MLGHTSLKTTQIYSKVIDTKVAKEMDDLSSVLEDKKKSKDATKNQGGKKIAM